MLDSFWKNVRRNEGCWEWLASVGGPGYGQFWAVVDGRRKLLTAHRVSFELHHRKLAPGECVLHRCDNRRCCNPDHLTVGTRADNNADMRAKGRGQKGAGNGHAILTDALVVAIHDDARPQAEIALQYGVSIPTVSMIQREKTWKHLWSHSGAVTLPERAA